MKTMKKNISFLSLLIMGLFTVLIMSNESKAQDSDAPKFEYKAENNRIKLDTMYVDDMNTSVEMEIEFENKGEQPLILKNVNGCCGTRIKDWPKKPLQYGETGTIKAVIRIAPRPQRVSRTVTAISNDPDGRKILSIRGIVAKK
ncbi:MAG: DUF1573 domain-containing protein [Bacteroidales bacterium]|nr:DUF1573 domain-containing protein [Bacteroidales bacterium]